MALGRRGQRFEANVWPGFVDAMTALLLVLIFVLSIFMIIQFVLKEAIAGKDDELDALTQELASLAQVLSLEQEKTAGLEAAVGQLRANLADENAERERLESLSAALAADKAAAEARIVDFEAQVAGLLADVGAAQDRIAFTLGMPTVSAIVSMADYMTVARPDAVVPLTLPQDP